MFIILTMSFLNQLVTDITVTLLVVLSCQTRLKVPHCTPIFIEPSALMCMPHLLPNFPILCNIVKKRQLNKKCFTEEREKDHGNPHSVTCVWPTTF